MMSRRTPAFVPVTTVRTPLPSLVEGNSSDASLCCSCQIDVAIAASSTATPVRGCTSIALQISAGLAPASRSTPTEVLQQSNVGDLSSIYSNQSTCSQISVQVER